MSETVAQFNFAETFPLRNIHSIVVIYDNEKRCGQIQLTGEDARTVHFRFDLPVDPHMEEGFRLFREATETLEKIQELVCDHHEYDD